MRKDQYLLAFGIICFLSAIAVYSTSYFACEEKENVAEVVAWSQASMYGLQSYNLETTSSNESSEGTHTTSSTKSYVAPDRYHGKNTRDDEWLEYVFIGDEQYFRASYGPEWRENGIFDGRQIFMQMTDDFRILGTLTNIEKLSDEKIDGVKCLHYYEKQHSKIDIEAELQNFETQVAENPEMISGTESMSLDEMKSQYREYLEKAAQTETDIDVWIGKDDYLVRQLYISTRSLQLVGDSEEEEWVTSTSLMKWTDHNESIEIVAPDVEWVPPEIEPDPPINSGTTPAPAPTPSPTPTTTPGTKTSESEVERDLSPNAAEADLETLVAGNNEFAFDLYNELKGEEGNIFFSPYSISTALAMIYAGARGETETQMADTLHFDLPQAQLHPAFNALNLGLTEEVELSRWETGDPFILNIANSLWGEQSYTFLPAFLDLLAKNYGAGMELVDFINTPEESRIEINDWVSDKTEEKIKDLIPAGEIHPAVRLVLANAIYFNADWVQQFDPSATRDAIFTLLNGEEVTVPMMSQDIPFLMSQFNLKSTGNPKSILVQPRHYYYTQGTGYQVVELPYVGGSITMTIIVPDTGEFNSIESSMSAEQIDEILKHMWFKPVDLKLPKFTSESSFSLKDTMIEMGMSNAFNGLIADFSVMDGTKDLFISAIFHKAFVTVDEEGTEAAAATGVVVTLTGGFFGDPVQLTIDRPFIYLIRDTETGTILFMGRVLDPTK